MKAAKRQQVTALMYLSLTTCFIYSETFKVIFLFLQSQLNMLKQIFAFFIDRMYKLKKTEY